MTGGFSYNSKLPSGRLPFWIKDDALVGLAIRPGDAVGVDVAAEPSAGDLVLAEIARDSGDSERVVRRYQPGGDQVRLVATSAEIPDIVAPSDQLFVVGVVRTRVWFEHTGGETTRIVEEHIE